MGVGWGWGWLVSLSTTVDERKPGLVRIKLPPVFTGFLFAIIAIGDIMMKSRRHTVLR